MLTSSGAREFVDGIGVLHAGALDLHFPAMVPRHHDSSPDELVRASLCVLGPFERVFAWRRLEIRAHHLSLYVSKRLGFDWCHT